MTVEHERIDFDVVFVGGGPASLAGAIRLMQLAAERGVELQVALIEKGAEIGSHAVSGAILNPVALRELMPDYREKGCPIEADVRGDEFHILTKTGNWRAPMTPRQMHNTGMHVISLSKFTRWMAGLAEEMGVNLFPGFAGTEVLFAEDGKTVTGVRTGDKGLDRDGKPKGNFEPGYDLMSKIVVLGEGSRGSLMRQVADRLGLFEGRQPQTFELGIKEVIQLPEPAAYFQTSRGNDLHFLGYPLGLTTPGGGFLYEMADNHVGIGYLVGLCYANPRMDPYDEFLKFKQHPFVARIIAGGKVVEQGARTVCISGYYSIPKLAVDGAMFIGGAAAMQNTPGLKGIHLAMKSGMLAAEACASALAADRFDEAALAEYPRLFEASWAKAEIFEGRNCAQALAKGPAAKFLHLGLQYVTKGKGLVDPMRLEEDGRTSVPLSRSGAVDAPDPEMMDGELHVDKLTGVYLSRAMHREDEPCHLVIRDRETCVRDCYPMYGAPCTKFCPGQVYEMIRHPDTGRPELKLNPSNCLHCKTCDIKDPFDNILWTCPEGGEGPGYGVV